MNKMEPKVLFEDESIVVVDKPSGMIVHGGPDSLSEWLVKRDSRIGNREWPDPERAGIVHRLDKETSGVMVLAKNPEVLGKLQAQFKSRETEKKYVSLLAGQLTPERGVIDLPLSRHVSSKTPMAVSHFGTGRGKEREAVTEYRVLKYLRLKPYALSLVEAHPITGRTHQLRVHFKAKGHPILGDPIYNTKESKRLTKELGVPRLFLHAEELSFNHPETGERVTFRAPLPPELIQNLGAA
jgi:23S rRNA pseudouridine1911/1915/1917 synthase